MLFNVKLGGWIETKNLPSDYVNDTLIKVKNIIENIFIPLSPNGLWLTKSPPNVINKKAFDIS